LDLQNNQDWMFCFNAKAILSGFTSVCNQPRLINMINLLIEVVPFTGRSYAGWA